MKKYAIRTFLRSDLETILEKKAFFFYTEEDIRAELARRDEFVKARENAEKYPELQLAFH